MILLLSIGLSIIVALLTGGHLSGLTRVSLRLGWLAFIALGLQAVSIYTVQPQWLPGLVLVASYLLLGAVVVTNIRTPGVALIALGLAANLAVIAANGALSLLNLCLYLIGRQMEAQAHAFETEGGFTERLYRIRSRRKQK